MLFYAKFKSKLHGSASIKHNIKAILTELYRDAHYKNIYKKLFFAKPSAKMPFF